MAQENEQQGAEQVQSQPAQNQTAAAKKSKASLIIIIVVVLVAILGLVGFFFLKDSIFPAKGLSGQVLSTNCKLNDKDLCRFTDSFKGLDNMSAKSVTTINGKITESTIEIQGSDKSHIKSSVAGKEESDYISIGNTTYMKDYSDNKWWKTTVDTKDASGVEKTDWKAEFEKSVNDSADKTTYKKIGKEACGNLTCLKYQVIDPNNKETTEYMWFDTKNYALRKVRSESADTVTETTFSYGKVNITEPSPVKEMTNPADAYNSFLNSSATSGAASEGLTPEQIQALQSTSGAGIDTSIPAE
ncbi:MAG: hypothetical protein Q7S53_01955 [bacterium]|nr:hypothetical protein [bacterium]